MAAHGGRVARSPARTVEGLATARADSRSLDQRVPMDFDRPRGRRADLSRVRLHGWTIIGPVWRHDERVWAVHARNVPGARRDHDLWCEAFAAHRPRGLWRATANAGLC